MNAAGKCHGTAASRGVMLRRPAFTLMEILLVLAIFVAVTAVSWPLLARPWAGQRLKSSADAVGAQLTRARVKAMSSGQRVEFRYSSDGRRYRTSLSDSSMSSPESTGEPTEDEHGAPPVQNDEKALPEGVEIVDHEAIEDTRSAAAADHLMDEPVVAMGDWSDPIFFYPDGTTSDARLLLSNEYEDRIELLLRGLTGVVTLGPVESQ